MSGCLWCLELCYVFLKISHNCFEYGLSKVLKWCSLLYFFFLFFFSNSMCKVSDTGVTTTSLHIVSTLSINHLAWSPTVLSTSFGKTFFAWRFILNENVLFWLTIFNPEPFVFSVSALCFQIFIVKCGQK